MNQTMSMYSLFKCLVSFHILAILLLIRSASSLNLTNDYLHHKCRVSQGKYLPGSQYEKDLNSIIRTAATDDFIDGFIHISNGEDINSTTIIFQCRGDSYKSKCVSCFSTAVAGFRSRCPRNKGGTIWYDQCFLDVNMINLHAPRRMNYENTFSMHNSNNVRGNTNSFNKKTTDFLHNLIVKADTTDVDGLNFLYYAAGELRLGEKTLYAMVQCAKDILSCKDCLKWSIRELSKCCDGKQGGRVLSTSCNLRYELYPFLRT
ncbi:putative cysteine-rich repeat secretory protein 33 [Capsella rubella]|uniref:putative cysteine-rich repeat secretory protein 33 n=1 Tax=Capsella rubella TaxID=81985 RepID=UPI000CD589A8|nr:putative cysteine-rich repeat secretory protein 33 [Capsella rubella]